MTVPISPRPAISIGAAARAGGTLRAALALLTRLPVRSTDEMASGAAAFPVVGVLVGLVGLVPLALLGAAEPALASLLAVAATTVLTGALHLDGLADTADALLAPDPTRAERARKDPAVGPGGAVTLILVLAAEVAALSSLASTAGGLVAGAALVGAAPVARTIPVLAVVLARSDVEQAGFGAWFAARVPPADAVVAVILAVLAVAGTAVLTRSGGIALGGLVGAGAGLLIAAVIVRGRRQLDGDGLGAMIELTLAASLIVVAVAS